MKLRSIVPALGAAAMLMAATLGGGAVASAHGQGGGEDYSFRDMGGTQWAAPYVSELAFQGIVQGVGNGDFRPNGPVTRAEAIAMITRAFWTGSSVPTTTLAFTDAASIPSWADASVEEAIQMGMLTNSGTLDPNGDASRAQVVTWIVAGMGLSGQAATTATTDLTAFRDASQIPPGDEGDMALGVQLGLINGVSSTQLAPDMTITRAQVAALIARAEAQFGATNVSTNSVLLTGTLSAVNTTASTSGSEATQGTIAITIAGGSTQSVGVAENAAIYMGDQTTPLGSLTTGGHVIAGLDAAGNAVFIEEALAQAQATSATEAEGKVTAISSSSISIAPDLQPQEGEDQGSATQSMSGQGSVTQTVYDTYTITPQTVVTFHGQALTVSAVTVGSQVHLQLDGSGNVVSINIQQMQESVSGTVVAVGQGALLITDSSGNLIVIRGGDSATITDASGNAIALDQIATGDGVTVTGTFNEDGLHPQTITITSGTVNPPSQGSGGFGQGDH